MSLCMSLTQATTSSLIEVVSSEGVAHRITLRECAPADQDFLMRLFTCTRAVEFAGMNLPEAQLNALLRMQFMAQDHSYRSHYPDADFMIVLRDGAPAGRLYVHENNVELSLIDISLLPEVQHQGVGTALLKALCAYADRKALPIRLHVARNNPAQRLYARFGFDVIAETDQTDVYLAMQRRATTQATD